MKETEDDRITAKIRQVFDEDFKDLSAEQGWQELRKRYPAPVRRPLLLWLSSAALLLVASGLWFFNDMRPRLVKEGEKLAAQKPKIADKGRITDSAIVIENPVKPAIISDGDENASLPGSGPAAVMKGAFPPIPVGENKASSQHDALPSSADLIARVPAPENSSKQADNEPADNKRDPAIIALAEMSSFTSSDGLEADKLIPVEHQPQLRQKSGDKGLSFSFYAGSFFNYAEGSESNLNFGAGFSSDIRLSKNIKLSTGLNLANNKLDFNQNIPGSTNKSFQDLRLLSNTSTSQTTISHYKAELLSLDIPLNIKYTIKPDQSDLYILAGLSSGTYLQEVYGARLQTFSNSGSFNAATTDEQITKKLEHFDLARTLNVSFGFSAKLSKSQKITIEPFLKYPLAGLGTENIKFGSSGVNIKLRINSSKK